MLDILINTYTQEVDSVSITGTKFVETSDHTALKPVHF